MAGAGYKLFNTGDVLTAAQVNTYLMQQTIMVFADSSARTTALSGVLAEGMTTYLQDTNSLEFYNGSSWVAAVGDITGVTAGTGLTGGGTSGTVTLTNDMAVTITAKGDLIVGTGNATYDNLAAGSSGDSLVADSASTTGLRWQGNYAAGKNKIINGDFGIWQRGTSFTTPALNAYTADRFYQAQNGTSPTIVHSQQAFTYGTAPVAGYESTYFYRVDQTVAGSAATFNFIGQKIEDVRTFANQTFTFSFWAKAASTITLPSVEISQVFGSGGSTSVNTTLTSSVSVGTSWTRYSYSVSVPSIAGKTIGAGSHLIVRIFLPLNSTFTFDTWGWQAEAGSVATAFQTATGTLQGELAACQRYYWRYGGEQAYTVLGLGVGYSTTDAYILIRYPVTMRTVPSSIDYSTLMLQRDPSQAIYAVTALANLNGTSSGKDTFGLKATIGSTNLTAGTPYFLSTNNSTSGYLGFSAEL
jgi:hypothetical protein